VHVAMDAMTGLRPNLSNDETKQKHCGVTDIFGVCHGNNG